MSGRTWKGTTAIGITAVATVLTILESGFGIFDRIWPEKVSAKSLFTKESAREYNLSTRMRPSEDVVLEFEFEICELVEEGLSAEEANRRRAAFYNEELKKAGADSDHQHAAVGLIDLYETNIEQISEHEMDAGEFQNVWGLNICIIGNVLKDFIADQRLINPGTHQIFVDYYEELPCSKIISEAKAEASKTDDCASRFDRKS